MLSHRENRTGHDMHLEAWNVKLLAAKSIVISFHSTESRAKCTTVRLRCKRLFRFEGLDITGLRASAAARSSRQGPPRRR